MGPMHSVVQRLFVAAAHRLGGASALSAHLRVSDSDLRTFLTGEAIPSQPIVLRAVDVVIDDFHTLRREFSPEAWTSLWGGGQ